MRRDKADKAGTWTQTSPSAADASRDCALCPRLREFILHHRALYPQWHNAPVNGFGDLDAELLIVGLAPGLRGANCTGRAFSGDGAGDLLYPCLRRLGLAEGEFGHGHADSLRLLGTRIVNAVRCVPPGNKPTAAEITQCRDFLAREIAQMPNLRVIVCLGGIAHKSVIALLGRRQGDFPFKHGECAEVNIGGGKTLFLIDSYHCSRYNTSTKRLTREMFEAVFRQALGLMNLGS